jgi:hypothetical protein
VMAAMPDATANPAIPPSSAATRFSSTSLVGFMITVNYPMLTLYGKYDYMLT